MPLTDCEQIAGRRPLRPVRFEDVRLHDNFWSPWLKRIRDVTLPHLLETTRPLVRDFEYLAGMHQVEGDHVPCSQPCWSDMFVYNTMETMVACLAMEPDVELESELDRLIDIMARAQDSDGYLNCYCQVRAKPRLNDIDGDELFVAGHLMEAAAAHCRLTGKRTLLDVAVRMADHIVDEFEGGHVPFDRSGCAAVEMGLVKLYDVTGKEAYLERARSLVEYARHAEHIDDAHGDGHAVRATNLFAGMVDVAIRTGDEELLTTAERAWRDMVNRRMYVHGGLGEVCTLEGFYKPYDLSDRKCNAEMCAALGSILLSHRLILARPDTRYADIMEQALYNGFLGSGGMDGRGIFYSVSIFSRGHTRRDQRIWCCPPNWTRCMLEMSEWMYAVSDDQIYVNLFAGSTAQMEVSGQKIELTQVTDYPWNPQVRFEVKVPGPTEFSLKLRVPGWSKGFSTSVNGEKLNALQGQDGYVTFNREWKAGDVVDLNLSMETERLEANPQIKTSPGCVALRRGPILYCFEAMDNGGKVMDLALPRDAELKELFEEDVLGGVVTVSAAGRRRTSHEWKDELYRPVKPEKETILKAVPFYARDNRQAGEMLVWIPETTLVAEDQMGTTAAMDAKVEASVSVDEWPPEAVNDGLVPSSPMRWGKTPGFKWGDRLGTEEWLSLTFGKSLELFAVKVYWLDEFWNGTTWAPESWRVEYLDEREKWQPVISPSGYTTDQVWFSRVNFEPVRTKALRVVAQLKEGKQGGIYQVRVLETDGKHEDR